MKQILKNPFVIIGLLGAALLAAWYFYDRRWYKFSNNGNSQWLPASNPGKESYQMNSISGLSVGDDIEVEYTDTRFPNKKTKIGELLDSNNNYNSPWVITALAATDAEGIVSGRLRKA